MSSNKPASTAVAAKANRKKRKKAKGSPIWSHNVLLPSTPLDQTRKLDEQKYGTTQQPVYRGKPARVFIGHESHPFQKVAFSCLERRECLIFSGHPSAGKNLVAEYTVGMALRDNQKVLVVCSSVSLCCRKYRDLRGLFGSVMSPMIELLIGEQLPVDMPMAGCLICTARMLRRLLVKDSPILKEVAWVVFDEVVQGGSLDPPESAGGLEESLMLLSPSVGCVFLGGPMQDVEEFGNWLVSLNNQPCHVIWAKHRKPPLKHYGDPVGGDGLFLLKDDTGVLKVDKFEKMQEKLKENFYVLDCPEEQEKNWWKDMCRLEGIDKADSKSVNTSVGDILAGTQLHQFVPCAVFFFTPQTAQKCCLALATLHDYSTPAEKAKIKTLFGSVLSKLDKEDQDSSMIQGIQGLLERGVGLYHSGILPVLRELIEILVEASLLKVLCCTEDYATYGRFPFRSVLLTGLYRSDGEIRKLVTSGEYAKVSALAGKVSNDQRGISIFVLKRKLKSKDCQEITKGLLDPPLGLTSLSDCSFLSLLKKLTGKGVSFETFVAQSLEEFKHKQRLPKLRGRLEELKKKAAQYSTSEIKCILKYKASLERAMGLKEMLWKRALRPDVCLEFLQPGRLVRVKEDWGWGVLMSVDHYTSNAMGVPYIVNVLLRCQNKCIEIPEPAEKNGDYTPLCIPFKLDMLDAISMLQLCLPNTLGDKAAQKSALQGLCNLEKRYPDGFPQLDIIQDMGLTDSEAVSMASELEQTCVEMHENPAHSMIHDEKKWKVLMPAVEQYMEAQETENTIQATPASQLLQKCKTQMKVFEQSGLVDSAGKLTTKGVGASEIEMADPVLCSDVLSTGGFDTLDKHSATAVTCMLLQIDAGVGEGQSAYDEDLLGPFQMVQKCAEKTIALRKACGQHVDQPAYMACFQKSLVYAMYCWSKGGTFDEICRFTGLPEGVVVDSMQKLCTLMLNLVSCARVLGNEKAASILEMGIQTVYRGITFLPSLYLSLSVPADASLSGKPQQG